MFKSLALNNSQVVIYHRDVLKILESDYFEQGSGGYMPAKSIELASDIVLKDLYAFLGECLYGDKG
ncbi:MAG: hypothetical protein K0Q87_3691 [Neobacillus sp.]|jgi:hypothetical protein|nr:hypothetical protein [Neobacillus sp.]